MRFKLEIEKRGRMLEFFESLTLLEFIHRFENRDLKLKILEK